MLIYGEAKNEIEISPLPSIDHKVLIMG